VSDTESRGLWVARDVPSGKVLLYVSDEKPVLQDGWFHIEQGLMYDEDLSPAFPNLQPGQCVRLVALLPVDEEQEREAFERVFGIVYPLHRNGLGDYVNTPTASVWQGWLAAKRDVGTQGG
jgi:hypothetical protein